MPTTKLQQKTGELTPVEELTPEMELVLKEQELKAATSLLESAGRVILNLSSDEGKAGLLNQLEEQIAEGEAALTAVNPSTGRSLLPEFMVAVQQQAINKLKLEKENLLLDTNPVSVARRSFANMIAKIPAGCLGDGKITITATEAGYYLTTVIDKPAAAAKAGKEEISFPVQQSAILDPSFLRDWKSYGYGFSAQKVCDFLGYEVGTASAYAVLCGKAKAAGKKSLQDFLAEKKVVVSATI